MDYQFTLDNFHCYITKSGEILTIIAENQRSGQLFTRVITKDDLKTISRDPSFDISTTYQSIKQFFEEKPGTASLSLTNNGKLTYSCQKSFRNLAKKSEFMILLEKREIIASSLKNVKKIDHNKQEREKFEWNPNSLFGLYFFFYNNDKTISGICSSTKHISTKQPLPRSQICKVSFLIEENELHGLGFGIASSQAVSREQPFLDSKAYMYYNGSYLWKNGQSTEYNGPCPQNGDILTFVTDTEKGDLVVDINGTVVDTHKFDAKYMKATDFYPFISKSGRFRVTLL